MIIFHISNIVFIITAKVINVLVIFLGLKIMLIKSHWLY